MKGMKSAFGLLAMASMISAGMGEMPEDRLRNVGVAGNFSGLTTPANLKKNRKKPVTMRKPKSKKRKH